LGSSRLIPRLLAQGWTDAIRHLHPGARVYTFWEYTRVAYDVRRSRSEGAHVILALPPRNATGAEQRLQDNLAAVNPELSQLVGPNPAVARLARGADAA
jgi:hypothetical protein